jgi:hypothetical protein
MPRRPLLTLLLLGSAAPALHAQLPPARVSDGPRHRVAVAAPSDRPPGAGAPAVAPVGARPSTADRRAGWRDPAAGPGGGRDRWRGARRGALVGGALGAGVLGFAVLIDVTGQASSMVPYSVLAPRSRWG